MNSQTADIRQTKPGRIISIDIIRGFTILVMIFVNDLAGVANVPAWMKHAHALHDGMTFVDWVFPAFLFIVGMSIPFSIGRRIERGESMSSIWKHILIRVGGLLLLGMYMESGDNIANHGIINPHLWILLMYVFIIIIWNRNSDPDFLLSKKWMKYIAAFGLLVLFFIYRGNNVTTLIQIRPSWWDILGLIGWAYLVACLFYIPLKKNKAALAGVATVLFCFYLAYNAGLWNHVQWIKFIWPGKYISYTLGSHPAIVLLGVVLGVQLREHLEQPDHASILKWAFGFSLFLFIAGLLLHELNKVDTMFIISKNLATVPWCLLSSAFTIWIWIAVYWLVDIKDFRSWFRIMEPAGINPLFAYILAPMVVECIQGISVLAFKGFNFYDWLGQSFAVGFTRALVIAFLMTWLPGYLYKKGIQLRL